MDKTFNEIDKFLENYNNEVRSIAKELRGIIMKKMDAINEQLDLSAKMIAYSYGNKYSQMICTIIPSKKAVKLGFSRGIDLHDSENILKGNGKISRYIELYKTEDINIDVIIKYLDNAYLIYKKLNTIK